jgi:hypothetical protein
MKFIKMICLYGVFLLSAEIAYADAVTCDNASPPTFTVGVATPFTVICTNNTTNRTFTDFQLYNYTFPSTDPSVFTLALGAGCSSFGPGGTCTLNGSFTPAAAGSFTIVSGLKRGGKMYPGPVINIALTASGRPTITGALTLFSSANRNVNSFTAEPTPSSAVTCSPSISGTTGANCTVNSPLAGSIIFAGQCAAGAVYTLTGMTHTSTCTGATFSPTTVGQTWAYTYTIPANQVNSCLFNVDCTMITSTPPTITGTLTFNSTSIPSLNNFTAEATPSSIVTCSPSITGIDAANCTMAAPSAGNMVFAGTCNVNDTVLTHSSDCVNPVFSSNGGGSNPWTYSYTIPANQVRNCSFSVDCHPQ